MRCPASPEKPALLATMDSSALDHQVQLRVLATVYLSLLRVDGSDKDRASFIKRDVTVRVVYWRRQMCTM